MPAGLASPGPSRPAQAHPAGLQAAHPVCACTGGKDWAEPAASPRTAARQDDGPWALRAVTGREHAGAAATPPARLVVGEGGQGQDHTVDRTVHVNCRRMQRSPVKSRRTQARVKPQVFRWIMDSAGWQIDEFGRETEISPGPIRQWREHESEIDLNYIDAMSKKARRPLSAFLPPAPPAESPIAGFRLAASCGLARPVKRSTAPPPTPVASNAPSTARPRADRPVGQRAPPRAASNAPSTARPRADRPVGQRAPPRAASNAPSTARPRADRAQGGRARPSL